MGRGADREEIDRMAREGLAEGYRLAGEARAVIASRYQDWMLVTIIFGLVLWITLLLLLMSPPFRLFGPYAMLVSTALVVAAVVPLLFINKRRFGARLAEQDIWLTRLRYPPYAPAGEPVSIFDLLADVSRQVPVWLSIRQRDRYRGHPFLNTAGSITGGAAAYLSLSALMAKGSEVALIFWAMAIVFGVLTVIIELTIRKAVRREREQVLARWRERMESSQQAMIEILGGP